MSAPAPETNRPHPAHRRGQAGASIITAIFLVTALAALGALMMQLMVTSSEETLDEWYSTQAFYAAEAGVEWAAYDLENGGDGEADDQPVIPGRAWFTTTVPTPTDIGGKKLITITSTGGAGGSAAAPRVQRRITVRYFKK